MNILGGGAVAALAVLAVLVVAIWAVKSLIIVVPPNRAAVITGRKRVTDEGETLGYRSVIGGRSFRIPIIETVEWMNLETIPIEIQVTNALSRGHIPLNIDAIADVKIASEPEPVFNNAVERLLDKSEGEVMELAKDTLMGSLRGVVATLTPEEVNEDRIKFAKAVNEDAHDDLEALGFRLDVLKIQNVSDDKGYLDAIGRERAAVAIRDAEIAEADNEAETRERQAAARQRAEVAEAEADIEVAEAENRYRVRQAELDQQGESAERTALVRAEQAEVEAQRKLEQERVETERERYRADVVIPAQARREAAEEEARAEAAPIRERGKAEAEVLRLVLDEVEAGGEQGLPVFLAEKLPELLGTAVDAVEGVDIERLVVVDGPDGQGVANAANQRLNGAYGTIERLCSSLGLDIERVLSAAVSRLQERDDGIAGPAPESGKGGDAGAPGSRRETPASGGSGQG